MRIKLDRSEILHADPMRVVDMTPSAKPVLASKVESSSSAGYKGKEVIQERMQISNDDRSDSIVTYDELLIQFGSISKDFLVNMTFTLPATFRAKELQSPAIKGDVEEKEAPIA